jgi:hypothetical protein
VDRLVKTVDWKMSTRKGRPTSFDRAFKAVAEKTEEELAQGARLSLFSLMVTVTFAPDEKSPKAPARRFVPVDDDLGGAGIAGFAGRSQQAPEAGMTFRRIMRPFGRRPLLFYTG